MHTRLLLNVIVLVAVLLVAVSPGTSTNAQDNKTACDPGSLIKRANGLTAKGDNKADMETLMKLATDIQNQNVACSGHTFTGKSSTLIGPMDLPKGNYKTTLTTRGRFTARLSVLSGDCKGSSSTASYYSVTSGEATNGAEAVLRSEGCRLVIESSNVRGPWTLTVSPLEADDPPLK
jgi:hypothetical protein